MVERLRMYEYMKGWNVITLEYLLRLLLTVSSLSGVKEGRL